MAPLILELTKFEDVLDSYIRKRNICLVDTRTQSVFTLKKLDDADKQSLGYENDMSVNRFGFRKINHGEARDWNMVRTDFFEPIKHYIGLCGREKNNGLTLYAVTGDINCTDLIDSAELPF